MSAGYLSNLLIKKHSGFEVEVNEVYIEGLASTYWQHFDQTSARVKGINHTCVCSLQPVVYSLLYDAKKR